MILIVTGSRSLATIPGAEAWAKDILRERFAEASELYVGDAAGPDAWACYGRSRSTERDVKFTADNLLRGRPPL